MSGDPASSSVGSQAVALCELYDRALPEVYGYLVHRCGSAAVAEDLASETFMAAVAAVQASKVPSLTVAWLIGVARHKLVDHWRRTAREESKLALAADAAGAGDTALDDWDTQLDLIRAHQVLAELGPHHRAALTLRYLDGLPVPEVATLLDRTLHATEALLVRARLAFRARTERRRPMPDPLEQLHAPVEPVTPRDSFRRDLRRRIIDALGVDPTDITIVLRGASAPDPADLPRRSTTMATTTPTTPTRDHVASNVAGRTTLDGIWPVLVYDDPFAAIRFMVEVLGFEEKMIVTDPSDPTVIVHSELQWPEGGIIQVAERREGNVFTEAMRGGSMYVITGDPDAVHARCEAAGAEIVVPMREVDYDVAGSKGFTVRDPGGVLWSFGQYGMVR